jgi:uncharacterized protein (DUF433 family)
MVDLSRGAKEATQVAEDIRFTAGIANLAEAARLLAVPQQTFHRWARGYDRGEPLIHVLAPPREHGEASVTFVALTEAHVLEALRRAGVRPQRIRPALRTLQRQFGTEYVLTAPELATDGIDVLWDFSQSSEGEGLIEGHTGQHVIREIVEDYLRYVTRDENGFPSRLQLRAFEPFKVVVDPFRSFGQPRFEGSGARVADVAAMLKAGEDVHGVAEEFGVSVDDVRAAARVLLRRAA